mgnify:CR=1 FL=1
MSDNPTSPSGQEARDTTTDTITEVKERIEVALNELEAVKINNPPLVHKVEYILDSVNDIPESPKPIDLTIKDTKPEVQEGNDIPELINDSEGIASATPDYRPSAQTLPKPYEPPVQGIYELLIRSQHDLYEQNRSLHQYNSVYCGYQQVFANRIALIERQLDRIEASLQQILHYEASAQTQARSKNPHPRKPQLVPKMPQKENPRAKALRNALHPGKPINSATNDNYIANSRLVNRIR